MKQKKILKSDPEYPALKLQYIKDLQAAMPLTQRESEMLSVLKEIIYQYKNLPFMPHYRFIDVIAKAEGIVNNIK